MAWKLAGSSSLGSYHQLELWLEQRTQSVANNTSVVGYEIGVRRTSSSSGAYWNNTASENSASLTVDGKNTSPGNFPYDFRSTNYVVVQSSSLTVSHNSDGSKYVGISGSISVGGLLPNGSASGGMWLTTIPRASTITRFDNFTIGSNIPWTVDRKHAAFTHTVELYVGNTKIASATGQGASGTLAITLAMKEQMLRLVPNATSFNATLKVTTYNGSTKIGSTTSKNATGSVGNDILPTFESITHNEFVEEISNKVGAYVQNKSRLSLAIVGPTGIYGSTIKSYKITLAGHTISAASGTTGVITQSGNLTITASVTDSRGRSAQATTQINILAYEAPKISNVKFERCTYTGEVDAMGTYIKVTFSGSVSSLMNGTEKNNLTYRILSKQLSEYSFTQKTNVEHSSLSYTGSTILSGYAMDYSFNFIARIVDVFSEVSSIGLIPIGEVLMHWHKSSLAIGMLLPGTKHNLYIGQKGLYSYGPLYQNDGKRVYDEDDKFVPGLIDSKATGDDSGVIRLPDGTAICWGSGVAKYERSEYLLAIIDYPDNLVFINTPHISAGKSGAWTTDTHTKSSVSVAARGNKNTQIRVWAQGAWATTSEQTVYYMAIGRWK